MDAHTKHMNPYMNSVAVFEHTNMPKHMCMGTHICLDMGTHKHA